MKKIFKKDIKGIKINSDIERLLDGINAGRVNTFDLRFDKTGSYESIAFQLLYNGNFEKSRYYDGNPFDFRRISWYLSDLFNATITDCERLMRTIDLNNPGRVFMAERFGLNTFEVIR